MMLLVIVLIIIIALIIERVIVCSRNSFEICPDKINKIKINNEPCYIFSTDYYNHVQKNGFVELTKDGHTTKIKGKISKIPVHVSEKLKVLSFDSNTPVNSIFSLWNCYTSFTSQNVYDNYLMISSQKINGLCICNNRIHSKAK